MGSHNAAGFRWWLSSEKIHQTGVILKDFSLKEFALTATTAVTVHIRCARSYASSR